MLTALDIVGALRTSRSEFARLFLQAQADVPAESRTEFEAVGRDPSDRNAFLLAVIHAQLQGWLDVLLDTIVGSGLEDGRIAEELIKAKAQASGDAALQAMVNAVAGFLHPHALLRGVADGMRWTVKVTAGNNSGTGVLIGPNLVLTAWHVVRSLFNPAIVAGKATFEPVQGSGNLLRFHFDDFLERVRRGANLRPSRSFTVSAAPNWYVAHSECHQTELADSLPANKAELAGLWDYCVIRLESAPGLDRRWVPLSAKAVVPGPDDRIILFQHPAGQPMRVDQSLIATPATYASDPNIPAVRFIHLANARSGSSGGPCFDASFSLFGLHQGVWSGAAANGSVVNRGVPLVSILDHVTRNFGGLPAPRPEEVPIWELGPTHSHAPILGQGRFQELVWRSALQTSLKIIVVDGPPSSGKSFLVRVLGRMLPDLQHLKIILNASTVGKLQALDLANAVLGAAGVEGALDGAPAPGAPDLGNSVDTTGSAWRRDEVARRIMNELETARAGRLVWLALTDLNKTEIEGVDAKDLLLLLYEQARAVEWLRIVLDGFTGDLPVAVRPVMEVHTTANVTGDGLAVTEQDVRTYLKRLNAQTELGLDEMAMTITARNLHARYRNAWKRDALTALEALADEAADWAASCLEVATTQGAGGQLV